MKLRNYLLIVCMFTALFAIGSNKVHAQALSSQSEISLLTCSPGEELHTLFGHSAIRVKDASQNIDWVFNYGTFDFQTPNFYMKFARGKLKYMLSATRYEHFERVYKMENRSIMEQKLNLDSISRQKLFQALMENYRPENRYYSYDFLFDNCSSRVRDIVENNTDGEIDFNPEQAGPPKTFWDLLDPYMENSRWIYLGIHLVLGKPCDKVATPYQYMFLPDHLMNAFARATIHNQGNSQLLAQPTQIIFQAEPMDIKTIWFARPITIFSIISIIILAYTIFQTGGKRPSFRVDALLFATIGLLGWVIFFMWFLTDHQATGPNLNILWAFPLHFPVALLLMRRKKLRWLKTYFIINLIILLVFIGGWPLIPQSLPLAILPILAAMGIRSLYIVKYYPLATK